MGGRRGQGRRDAVTRRRFLQAAAGAGAGGLAAVTARAEAAPASPGGVKTARVVLVRDARVLDEGGAVQADVIGGMLDDAVKELFREADPRAAWAHVAGPQDTVGVKTNVWRFLRTPPELQAAIVRRLMDVGVDENRIGVSDRGVLRMELFRNTTALVNVRPMRTHHWAGVGSLIKNYIMFSPYPPDWHEDSCANLAGLWDLPMVKGKTRLNILVMLTPLFQSKGPHDYQARYTWPYKGVLVGTDPVAVDATGLRILEAKRRQFFGEDVPFAVSPKHIRVAEEKFALGVADPERIELRKLGWADDILI
ncbi:MAG: DUF362 domain-containing protein [Candidatus Hydrogenedentes bacterium]|nr:DUF362 domain-containing protein [Candidatus Hydrogenedentota bacterium]